MKSSVTLGLVALVAALTGCAVNKTLVPTGGSRADGTIKLSFEHGSFETPKVDEAQGLVAARQRCIAWGYSNAEAFGGFTRQCNQGSAFGCDRWMVTMQYQCTGNPPGK